MGIIRRGLAFCKKVYKFGPDNAIKGRKIRIDYLKHNYNPFSHTKIQEQYLKRAITNCKLDFTVIILGDENEKTYESVKAQLIKPKDILYGKTLTNINEIAKKEETDYIVILPSGCLLSDVYLANIAMRLQDESRVCPKLIYTDSMDFKGNYFFKSDYGPDSLSAQNYIGNIFAVNREAFLKEGGFQKDDIDSGIHEFLLSFTKTAFEDIEKEEEIMHITSPLDYYPTFELEIVPFSYEIQNHPKISILIPNKDNKEVLKTCIDSVLTKSTYDNYEIIIIENNSEQQETFDYYESLTDERIKVITCVTDWNYSYINNYGLKSVTGEYVIFLNNDTEVISSDWMEQMLYFAQRKDVGAVGAKLLYPDHTIQHGGVTLGIRGIAGHAFLGFPEESKGYMNRLICVQNVSAVTAACMMVKKTILDEVKGFDEDFAVAFNDVDLCMRIRKLGYRIVMNPHARLFHYESKSRGHDENNAEKLKRFNRECDRFGKRWYPELMGIDPYYNRNLTMSADDFSYADIYE
ncbi:MAG: glycosyltransferase family 2 protein [Lachnospiraceae bacterium]|nr:glycosyltransferase family 2 protein [Lachnospiraceae bacterium]